MSYAIPEPLHASLRGRTVAIVDDAINAGSATRATHAALIALGARPVAIGALIILGNTARPYFAADNLAIESIARLANELGEPAACPLCAAGMPLSSPSAAG
jgi:orotate phosphoribosyltransferase